MDHGKAHYDKITSLTRQLSNSGSTVTKRREIAKELEKLLSNHDVRKQLAIETTPRESVNGLSTAARRCHLLSMLWSNALSRCVLTTKEILYQSKVKVQLDDLRWPDKILRASFAPDDAFSNGLGIPKLSKKSLRSALKLCLEILQNEKNIPQGGEQVMMDMLAFLCSKEECVGCFKYAVDYRNVLDEIFYRLKKQDEVPAPIFDSAAKAFGEFFSTCNLLGVEVHSFLSDSLENISDWCKINVERNTVNSSSSSRQHFFNAIATMICSHPDHAIGPMKRYGRHILRYCIRAYATARSHHKDALNRFIVAHLFVAQVAGKIQGLIDGDLGDLGSASLTERQLMDLLDLGINDVVKAFENDANAATVSRKRRLDRSNQGVWCPVDDRQKLQLEVVTRLLSCAQRLYISRESWNALDNPDEMLGTLLKVPSSNKDGEWVEPELTEAQELPVGVLAKSPWMHFILRKLTLRKYGHNDTEELAIDGNKNPFNVVLQLISNDNETLESPVPYLAIIAASAECFPAGECWASSATENWNRFVPEDKRRGEVMWCHGSSAFDLVSLLSILAKLLEEHGQPESDSRAQYWIVLILTKLTETTAILVQRLIESTDNRSDITSLTMIWRTIWKTLIRGDLRYTSFTSIGENSLGEILVILLTEIIARRCTDLLDTSTSASQYRKSSFVFEQQKFIWTLFLRKPVIFTRVGSRAQFELILSMSKFVGLSECKYVEESERPLRQELLHLSLSSLKVILVGRAGSTLNRSRRYQLIRSVASCIVCLVNGSFPAMPRLASTSSRFLLTRCGDQTILHEENKEPLHVMQLGNNSGIYLKLLWDEEEMPAKDSDLSCFKLHTLKFDPPFLVAKRLRDSVLSNERLLQFETADFISEGDSEKLRRRVFSFISEEIPYIPTKELSVDISDGATVQKEAQSVAVKLVLSLLISQKSLETDLLAQIPDIVSFFTRSISDLAGSYFQPVEYLEVALNLARISKTLIEIITRNPTSVDLSQRMADSIEECRLVLKQYSCHSTNDDQYFSSNKPNQRMEEGFRNDDSDFDPMDISVSLDKRDIENLRKNKRKEPGSRAFYSKRAKRGKTNSTVVAPPDLKCAKAIGSLLLAMEPSFSNCRLVCENLLGTDIDIEPESIEGDMDLTSVADAVSFLGMREVLLNKSANPKDSDTKDAEELSPIVMLCQVIDLVRECAAPFSRLFLYGNFLCATVGVEALKLGLTMTPVEAKLIVGVLTEGGMNSRLSLRAQKIEAATYIFENGSDDFLALFDKFFTNSIVKAGFDDPNFFLRRLASVAAGSACSKFDEQRLLNSVSNRIAPISSSSNAQKTIGTFTKWYVRSGLSSTEEEDKSVIEAKDSLEAMESDSIFAKVLLAGSMRDEKAFIKLLQEILETPVVRPGLEFMCYRALEKLSLMRGYSDVQELVDLEAESILAVWLQKAKDANDGTHTEILSPTLTSPKAVWYIMLYGRYDYLVQSQFSSVPNDESVNFRNQSGVNFVSRYRGFIVPFTLLHSHDIITKCNSSNSIVEFLSNDLGFKVVLTTLGISEDDSSDSVVKILKGHAIAIETMCVLLIHSEGNLTKNVGQGMLDNFRRVLSVKTIESKQSKSASLLIHRIIQLAGQTRSIYETMTFSEPAYYQAIKHLTSHLSQPRNTPGDAFIHAGTSLTEVTIYAYDKLVKSKLIDHQLNAWSRFALLGEFLAEQFKDGGEQIQMDFFLHVLIEIVSNTSLHKRIRAQALIQIQKVLRQSLSLNETELDRQLSPVINKLIGVCFHVHEESQRNLLYDLRQKMRKHKFDLRRSRGFRQYFIGGLELQCDEELSASRVKRSIHASSSGQLNHDCLVGTHHILLWIVQNKESLRLDSCVFANLSNPLEVEAADLEVLAEADKRYSAQTLSQDSIKKKKVDTLHQYISVLKQRTLRSDFLKIQKNPVFQNVGNYSLKHTTIDERLLCAELSQMENLLEEARMGDVSSHDINRLLSYVCFISQTSNSSKVRLALSRCIALLEPSNLVNVSGSSATNVASSKSNFDDLQLKLRATCIDCLAGLLKSARTEVGMAAVMTLKVILSNDVGRNSCSVVAPSTASLIKPFVSKENLTRVNATILFDGERRALTKFFGKRDEMRIQDERLWCWDKTFWTFDNGAVPQFEVWIRRLTSAIIICCFNPTKLKHMNGKVGEDVESSFFWHCQRIAYLDHTFASTIFPLLILTIVQREEQHFDDDQNFNGLNESISSCFESVLQSWKCSHKSIDNDAKNELRFQSVSIVIDTLDVLRKVSQRRFLSSKHKPNKSTTKKTKKGRHNVGLDPLVLWRGVSYGTILNMDGIVVAEACMEVQRFASALFFLEIYFNSEYGKSGGLFQELDNTVSCQDIIGNFKGVQNISGMTHFSEMKASHHDDYLKARTMKAMSMTSRCYKELGEIELMHATNMQLSSLNFTDNSESMTIDLDRLRGTSALDTLQMLSFHSSQMSDPDNRLLSSLTDSMEAVGLEGLINTYIEGVYVQNKDLKEMVDVPVLREKWFENSLGTQNWTLLSGDMPKPRIQGPNIVASSGYVSDRGYFELVSESLDSLSNSDTISAKLSLDQAQSRVIDSLSDITGERLFPERFIGSVDKLRALQDVRRLIEDELDLSTFDFDQMWMLKTSSRIRQIALTCFASKYAKKTKAMKLLNDHLWKTCDSAVNVGRPQVAEAALSKLKYILNLKTKSDSSGENHGNEILRIRLEEAKIMECRSDFNGAIQRTQQLIRLIGDRDSNKIQKCLLCDAQILCGSWMTKYKTQQAREILESYLNPAAARAKRIFEDAKTTTNTERATRVFIQLGHKLSNLHDDLLSRIHSKEWEETETRLRYQNQQCLDSVKHRRELKEEFGKIKRNSPRKDELYKHWKETEGHFLKLEKEYERTNRERDEIKKLVPHYLKHALKSFLSALEMAGTSSDDLSSHIFRMVSLWFSYQNDTTTDSTGNDVMQEGLCKVPSFRFVTLTNQLFARIDTCEGVNDQKFQVALQSLVFRMCNDHPYHCIAPLVALMNGKVASKKLGAQQIIDEMDKSGTRYVKDLLHSYRILISAYNDLAHASTTKYQGSSQEKKKKIKFSELFPSAAKKSLDRCLNRLRGVPCVITCPPLIRPGKDYGCGKEDPIGGERIAGFEPDFAITETGIHRPKIVMCTGSQGGSFRQLVKGEDDIRQDAIMSQVFTYVNNLMKRRTNSSDESRNLKNAGRQTRRRLNMITYNVMPLSPSSGVSNNFTYDVFYFCSEL